ncbi:hypothetical protein PENDEC_c019G04228 [Penicillium decumbens]|uniref:Uncharacterized protein n=1 Tax=Penicillium decumbens TaxID=69771 RepID=A0A1V6P6Z6_PENDC|nr:hypothetical protein PENDEC_c019G04228 [Penicillium decumbens]
MVFNVFPLIFAKTGIAVGIVGVLVGLIVAASRNRASDAFIELAVIAARNPGSVPT